MKKIIDIKDVKIGQGIPKICISITGNTVHEIIKEAEYIKELPCDIAEWRTDFFNEVEDISKVIEALGKISDILKDKPVIFTFRSRGEGGEREISTEFYFDLNKAAVESRLADIIDVELFKEEKSVRELIDFAHEKGAAVIVSNHDFNKTPEKDEIISRLCRAQEIGGDIPKIAVMPLNASDVITLLDATRIMKEKYAKGPLITMAMSGKGIISRLSGELFGSDVTFGAAKKASAPGQISVKDLRSIINLLHENL